MCAVKSQLRFNTSALLLTKVTRPAGIAPLAARVPSRLLLAGAVMAREHFFLEAPQIMGKGGHRSMDLLRSAAGQGTDKTDKSNHSRRTTPNRTARSQDRAAAPPVADRTGPRESGWPAARAKETLVFFQRRAALSPPARKKGEKSLRPPKDSERAQKSPKPKSRGATARRYGREKNISRRKLQRHHFFLLC